MMKLFDYFIDAPWSVLYKIEKEKYRFFKGEKGYWYADPFLYSRNGKLYLFTEAFYEKKQIGKIAISEFNGVDFVNTQIIIENPYHMSYPNVFEIGGKVFLLPETGENRTLEIYICKKFPCDWEKIVLLNDVDYADSTIFINGYKSYIITYCEKELSSIIYELNIDGFKLKKINTIKHNENKKRPAGNFFYNGEKLYRPTQNCTTTYGGSILINEINDIECLEENIVKEIMPIDIGGFTKTHTYNKLENVEVFDVVEKPTFKLVHFHNRVKRKIHKIKFSWLKKRFS